GLLDRDGSRSQPPRSIRGDNVGVIAPYTVTPKQGLENVLQNLGSAASVTYESGAGGSSGRDAAVVIDRDAGRQPARIVRPRDAGLSGNPPGRPHGLDRTRAVIRLSVRRPRSTCAPAPEGLRA